MGHYGYYGYYYDSTYFLVLIGAVLCLWAQFRVKSTYNKYAQVR
ncbi:MAG: zinc metallopeptidase, partial [Lachnospiraceae bacterium]|nr:zinc metallopeptidase [Lachnospiraceae bacterium]